MSSTQNRPIHQWTHAGNRVWIVKNVSPNGESYNGFKWPLEVGAVVKPLNFSRKPDCASGGYCDAGGQYYLPHIGLDDHGGVKQTIASARKSLPRPESGIAREFVEKMQSTMGEGGSVEITSGGNGVRIDKDGVTSVGK
jgi:hypothetical protein